MKLKRNITCGAPRAEHEGNRAIVNGWINAIRETAGAVFVDLRDADGLLQLVFDAAEQPDLYAEAKRLGREFVIAARGAFRKRGTANPEMATGEVELFVEELEILNGSETPPFEIRDEIDVDPEIRQKYRFVDLRRPHMANMLKQRHRLTQTIRSYFDTEGFTDVETPTLTKATPEGARDFIVPARLHPGLFYALPQSPQIFKQILMVAGVEKYIQIVRCFRDEDKRADRQPEFTQLDMEMSFVEVEDVQNVIEGCVRAVMKEVTGVEVATPLRRISHGEAMTHYGIDRPDMRFAMELVDLSEMARSCGFGVFSGAVEAGGVVKALCIPGGHELVSKGQFKKLEKDAKGRGAKGLAFIRYVGEELESPIAKFLNEEELKQIKEAMSAQTGDLLLFVADKARIANGILAEYRLLFAGELGLRPQDSYEFLWVQDFPLFEYDEETNRLYAAHHPFTAPANDEELFKLAELMRASDRRVTEEIRKLAVGMKANAYDLILNGYELGGGSIRIHRRKVQDAMFDCLGIGPEEARAKFGFLLDALSYGAPPMGGIALGIDRWVMLTQGLDNIQDVIAFPKTAGGKGMMDGSPAEVDVCVLNELQIKSTAE